MAGQRSIKNPTEYARSRDYQASGYSVKITNWTERMLRKEIIDSTKKSIEVRAAQYAPLTLRSDIRGPRHFVQFYESDTFLVHSIADYVSSGLKAGETCIVAATDKHLKMLESFLSQ